MHMPTQLRFVQFNVQNLFIYLDQFAGKDLHSLSEAEWKKLSASHSTSNKELHKLWRLSEAIKDMNPDILMLNEVGGPESLENFNRLFLKGQYTPLIKEGNSDRGIDVGYLVKPSQELEFLLISHKDRPINFLYPHEHAHAQKTTKTSHLFSRDVAELRAFSKGSNTPCFVTLLTHLKSKLDRDGIDFQGKLRREAEFNTLLEIYEDLNKELDNKVPIVVAGDFNGHAANTARDPEFLKLNQTDLHDVFDNLELSSEQRITQIQFLSWGSPKGHQLDYIFVSPHWKEQIDREQTKVYRYKDELGSEMELPLNADQMARLPSDHYPVVVTIKLP